MKNIFNDYCDFVECEEHSQEWHDLRSKGIGGSDASSALGMNPHKSNVTLYLEKIGTKEQDDLSGNEAVYFGSKSEDHNRAIYALMKHKEVIKPNGTFISKKYPFMRYNADGVILDDNGLWEGKAVTIRNYSQLKDWDGRLPQMYYVQCIHALAVTNASYIHLSALLRFENVYHNKVAEIREFEVKRDDVLSEIEFIIEEEKKFWQNVSNKEEPFLKYKY